VLLFGMGRLEAFPIDTWVQKILIRSYGLEGWKTELLLDFARIHFGAAAGLAQQYLFAAARDGRIARP
jgi:N-glycosylase/DNA lyase